jgi:hypothetical protein
MKNLVNLVHRAALVFTVPGTGPAFQASNQPGLN